MEKLTDDLSGDIEILSRAFGLTVESETYEPKHFGDAILVLTGRGVSFRIVRDRTEVFLDVRGAADDWIDVRNILGSMGLLASPLTLHPIRELIDIVSENATVFSHRIEET